MVLNLGDVFHLTHKHSGGDGALIDHGDLVGANYYARVVEADNWAISTGAWEHVYFYTESTDPKGMHNSTNANRLTIVSAGFYIFGASITFAANATGARHLRIQKNGSTQIVASSCINLGASLTPKISTTSAAYLDVDDFINCQVYQNSGGDLNILGGYLSFWAAKIA